MRRTGSPIDVDEIIERMDLIAATFPRKALAARLGKRYQTMDNEIKHRELGTSNAKLGQIDALRILGQSQAADAPPETRRAGEDFIRPGHGLRQRDRQGGRGQLR